MFYNAQMKDARLAMAEFTQMLAKAMGGAVVPKAIHSFPDEDLAKAIAVACNDAGFESTVSKFFCKKYGVTSQDLKRIYDFHIETKKLKEESKAANKSGKAETLDEKLNKVDINAMVAEFNKKQRAKNAAKGIGVPFDYPAPPPQEKDQDSKDLAKTKKTAATKAKSATVKTASAASAALSAAAAAKAEPDFKIEVNPSSKDIFDLMREQDDAQRLERCSKTVPLLVEHIDDVQDGAINEPEDFAHYPGPVWRFDMYHIYDKGLHSGIYLFTLRGPVSNSLICVSVEEKNGAREIAKILKATLDGFNITSKYHLTIIGYDRKEMHTKTVQNVLSKYGVRYVSTEPDEGRNDFYYDLYQTYLTQCKLDQKYRGNDHDLTLEEAWDTIHDVSLAYLNSEELKDCFTINDAANLH